MHLDHGEQRTGKHPPELSSDVQHVHLAATHHHPDQSVIVGSSPLQPANIRYDDTHVGHKLSLQCSLCFW